MSELAIGLRDVYAGIAELWCSPRDVDLDAAAERARLGLVTLNGASSGGADMLSRFLAGLASEEEYVELFELAPQCSLYLGSHGFDEPTTCSQAAVSDRNGYMIELIGIYRHFGVIPEAGELPDYLPLITEFLSLTAGSGEQPRRKLIEDYVLPLLPTLRARLEGLQSPYLHLLDTFARVLEVDLETGAEKPLEVTHA
jgi:nitrate reductase molybdenum cofactor assembly chaperone NarJ/NarW